MSSAVTVLACCLGSSSLDLKQADSSANTISYGQEKTVLQADVNIPGHDKSRTLLTGQLTLHLLRCWRKFTVLVLVVLQCTQLLTQCLPQILLCPQTEAAADMSWAGAAGVV